MGFVDRVVLVLVVGVVFVGLLVVVPVSLLLHRSVRVWVVTDGTPVTFWSRGSVYYTQTSPKSIGTYISWELYSPR